MESIKILILYVLYRKTDELFLSFIERNKRINNEELKEIQNNSVKILKKMITNFNLNENIFFKIIKSTGIIIECISQSEKLKPMVIFRNNLIHNYLSKVQIFQSNFSDNLFKVLDYTRFVLIDIINIFRIVLFILENYIDFSGIGGHIDDKK